MGLITLMVIIGAAVVGVTVTVTLVSIAPNIASRTNRELRTTRYQLSSANKALRSIANWKKTCSVAPCSRMSIKEKCHNATW